MIIKVGDRMAYNGSLGGAPSEAQGNSVGGVREQSTPHPETESILAFRSANEMRLSIFITARCTICKARSCDRMSSVCPSVTLVDHDHIG